MLHKLPHELIQRILRLSLPDTITRTTYGKRQEALSNFCLVSKHFLKIVRPMLEATLKVVKYSQKDGDGNRQLPMEKKGAIQVVIFEFVRPDIAFNDCKALRTVSLHKVKNHNLRWTELLPHLTRLNLFKCVVLHTPKCLPSLVELSTSAYFLDWKDTRDTFFTAATFPSLRSLAFSSNNSNIGPKPQPSLLEQLLVLVVEEDDVKNERLPSVDLNSNSPPVLVDVVFDGDQSDHSLCQPRASHVRLYRDGPSTVSQTSEEFKVMTAALLPDSSFDVYLKMLLLPPHYALDRVKSASLRKAIESFLEACQNHGIEVDYEERDEAPGASLISYQFKRWAIEREQRKKLEEMKMEE